MVILFRWGYFILIYRPSARNFAVPDDKTFFRSTPVSNSTGSRFWTVSCHRLSEFHRWLPRMPRMHRYRAWVRFRRFAALSRFVPYSLDRYVWELPNRFQVLPRNCPAGKAPLNTIRGNPGYSEEEERLIILGLSNRANLLVVCHCYRASETVIRINSARKATKQTV